MAESQALMNRMYLYYTKKPMRQLLEWGMIKLNQTMWLMIWREHIENFVDNKINTEYITENNQLNRPANTFT